MNTSIVLGVDIGGSHITAALVNLNTKQIEKGTLIRANVNSKNPADEIISIWTNVMQETLSKVVLTNKRIGIAMPGPFDYYEGISLMRNQDKYDALYGFNVKRILANNLSIRYENIQFMNDAESFLKGEVFSGAAMDLERVVGLTLGTGLGSSTFSNGLVEDADLWCSPFRDSIAEEYLSTRWFKKRYKELTGKNVEDVKQLTELENIGKIKEQIFQEFGENMALFLNGFINEIKPQAIILGGNIANAYELFAESLNRHLKTYDYPIQIHKTMLGEDACLIGAASSWYKNKVQVL